MKNAIRIIALAAALAALFCACRKEQTPDPVMSVGETAIDEGSYRFLYATYKARYLARYSDASDVASFWSAEHSDGVTNAEWMDGLIRDSIRMQLSAEHLFDTEGLKLPDDKLNAIDEYISDIKNERFGGDDEKFAEALAEFGTDENGYRSYLAATEKMSALFEHYYGSAGTVKVTEGDRDKYMRENYVRFVQININDAYVLAEEDGHYIQNVDGSYERRALTDGELAEKQSVIAEIDRRLAAGEALEELYAEYSENVDYPNGYYFSALTAADYDETIVAAAFALAEGEQTKLHTEHGTFYIKRLALDSGAYAREENADFFGGFESAVKNSLYDEMLRSRFGEIAEVSDRLNALSVTSVAPNYDLD